jgi:hypothetical protein
MAVRITELDYLLRSAVLAVIEFRPSRGSDREVPRIVAIDDQLLWRCCGRGDGPAYTQGRDECGEEEGSD